MKAWIVSDLHRDYNGKFTLEPPSGADIALIAGDVCDDEWLIETARKLPVVFVAGNHEFYGWSHDERVKRLGASHKSGVAFLDDEMFITAGPDIAGATLWTDYNNDPLAAETARRSMNDHRRIAWRKRPWQRFLPSHATKLHRASLSYLRSSHADVIMTHHAPHRNSVHPKYDGQLLNYAYFSDVLETFDHPPRLWVHGHTHSSFRYQVGKTLVICNPMGYGQENSDFNASLVVDL